MDTPENETPSNETRPQSAEGSTKNGPLDSAAQAIAEAEATAASDPAALPDAIKRYDQAIELLSASGIEQSDDQQRLLGLAELGKANALANANTADGIQKAIAGFQLALERFEAVKEPSPSDRADVATTWSNLGQTQSRIPDREVLEQAIGCLRQAISVLDPLPWKENARYRLQLAIAWLNLGNAYARVSNPLKPEKRTMDAFEKALDTLGDLPAKEATVGAVLASIRSSVGKALMWSLKSDHLNLAIATFEETIRTLAAIENKSDPRLLTEMASAHANRAILYVRAKPSIDTVREAMQSSKFALQIAMPKEKTDLAAAEITLAARISYARAYTLSIGSEKPEAQADIRAKTALLVSDGLKLAAAWEANGATGLRHLARATFDTGCAFYCDQEPEKLPEFISTYLNFEQPDEEMRASAHNAVAEAIARLVKIGKVESDLAIQLNELLQKLKPAATA